MMGVNGNPVRRALRALPVALMLAGVACDSSTAPKSRANFETSEALQDYRAMENVFATNGWSAFTALAGRTPLSSRAGISALQTLPGLGRASSGRRFALKLFDDLASARARNTRASIEIISDTIRGRTFTYNAARDEYVVNPTRTGAPVNGVRFILYEVGSTNRPVADREIGYADFLDEGQQSDDKVVLRLVAVERGITILNYRAQVESRDGSGRIDVDGFVANGSNKLTFEIGVVGDTNDGNGEVELNFELGLDARDFRVVGFVKGVKEGAEGEGTVELTVKHGDQLLLVSTVSDGESIDGEIELNGETFVTISGNAQSPTLLGATGQPITGSELLVVLFIIDIVDDQFDLVRELLQPVDNLLVLGWIL